MLKFPNLILIIVNVMMNKNNFITFSKLRFFNFEKLIINIVLEIVYSPSKASISPFISLFS